MVVRDRESIAQIQMEFACAHGIRKVIALSSTKHLISCIDAIQMVL